MALAQTTLRKMKPQTKFWYIENHTTVIEGLYIGAGLALINGKYEAMNIDTLVYKTKPVKSDPN